MMKRIGTHKIMVKFLSRDKQFKEQVKRQFLSRWISSFMITTAIVIVTIIQPIILSMTPALASFTEVNVIGDVISYQLSVSDPDQTLTTDTLVLEISNPFETLEEPLVIGATRGTFTMNYPRYDYHLAIKASKGFGLETLDEQVVKANLDELSGAIINVHLDETLDPLTSFELSYRVHVLYSDPRHEIDSISLWWGVLYREQLADNPDAVPDTWTEAPILAEDSGLWLTGIYNENVTVVMKLVAIDDGGQERVLDTDRFMTPLHINASVYISDVTPTSALASIYVDHHLPIDIDFTLDLLKDGTVVNTQDMIIPTNGEVQQYEGFEVWYNNLSPHSIYQIILYGDYIDPLTNVPIHQNLSHQTFILSPPYSIDGVILEENDGYHVTITITDVNQVLSDLTWILYTPSDGYDMYLDSGPLSVDLPTAPQQIYTGIVAYPTVTDYYIVIRATKTIESSIYYSELLRFDSLTLPTPTP